MGDIEPGSAQAVAYAQPDYQRICHCGDACGSPADSAIGDVRVASAGLSRGGRVPMCVRPGLL